MISVALVHGGIKPLFFPWRLYHSIASRPTPPVTLEEVDDRDLQEQLQRVITAETLAEASIMAGCHNGGFRFSLSSWLFCGSPKSG
ncbi:hypothetical protein AMECASPLE_039653 [Ameca splendens]|uniref:Uncharacterized protein n=1 Tax=Ameca splendens TaxID=208324 RepID=A0ABV1AG30_9TELE